MRRSPAPSLVPGGQSIFSQLRHVVSGRHQTRLMRAAAALGLDRHTAGIPTTCTKFGRQQLLRADLIIAAYRQRLPGNRSPRRAMTCASTWTEVCSPTPATNTATPESLSTWAVLMARLVLVLAAHDTSLRTLRQPGTIGRGGTDPRSS